MVRERIEDEGVTNKEFIFEFAHDGFAGFGPTAPMYVAQRVAVAIVAQGDEFIALADIGGKGDAARLVFHCAGQSNWRKRVAPGQDERGLG